jgi:hypothetical protein
VCLAGWYLLLTVETGFTVVNIASRNSRLFIKTNALFILLYFSAAFLARGLGAYAVPLGLFIAQAANLASYSYAALARLRAAEAAGGNLHA